MIREVLEDLTLLRDVLPSVAAVTDPFVQRLREEQERRAR